MLKASLFTLLLMITSLLWAQDEWVKDRELISAEDATTEGNALTYLYKGIHYDYKYDKAGKLICDITIHEIIRVTNEDGLESKNKIYIPMSDVIEVIDIKSRTISPSGKVVELDQNNIKELKDEETDAGYRIFAVEGAEVGGEIEYRYVKRVGGPVFQSLPIQLDAPIKKYEFGLKCPENLEFDFFTANDSFSVIKEDSSETFNEYGLEINDIPTFHTEAFSGLESSKTRLDFKLAYNSASRSSGRLNTFHDAGTLIYNTAHEMTKNEQRLVENFINKHSKPDLPVIERLKYYENEIKTHFYTDDRASQNLEALFTEGFGHRRAFLKLMIAIVEHLGINYEIVITSNRREVKFEPTFDSWTYLDNFLIRFPEENEFMAVHDQVYRYGYVSPENTALYGLYVKPEKVTDFVYPISRIDYIPEEDYRNNVDNLELNASLIEETTKMNIQVRRSFEGGEAGYYKAGLLWADEEQKGEILNELIKYLSKDADIQSVRVVEANNDFNNWDKPFTIESDFITDSYVERAGNSILLKVGEFIGLQTELYQEEERKFEIENGSNRGYTRQISIEIPKGYEIQNPDDVVLNKIVTDNEKEVYAFKSEYKYEGNKIQINIEEFYNEIFFPIERYEEFRAVVNAAADWNKTVLVLKPKL